MVVGCIAEWDQKILLCRRAIEPRHGKWTLPAGYLENGETVAEGAARETYEEARAKVEILTPYALYNICYVNQIYFMFRARLADQGFRPGSESLDVKLFAEDEIPWEDIAFRVIQETLIQYYKDRPSGQFPFYMGEILSRNLKKE
jgi:ADP-ribose pyrophosphatase YjhB (NUDIX family)